MPGKTRAQLCVIELEVELNSGSVFALLTVPNREGTLTRKWTAREGFLSSPQAEDLRAWVFGTLLDALALRGVQMVLSEA